MSPDQGTAMTGSEFSPAGDLDPGEVFELGRRRVRALVDRWDTGGAETPEMSMSQVCRMVLILDGLEALDGVPSRTRSGWRDRILGSQAISGFFQDGTAGHEPSRTEGEPLDGQPFRTTLLALQALDALGAKPRHRLATAEEAMDSASLPEWVETLDWSRPVLAGDRLACVLAGLVYRAEEEGEHRAPIAYHRILDHLASLEDRQEGLWGSSGNPVGPDAIETASRIVPFFTYVRRPLRRVSRIVDASLAGCEFEVDDEPFQSEPGRPVAAAWLLASLRSVGHRQEEIDDRLRALRQLACAAPVREGTDRGSPTSVAGSKGAGGSEPLDSDLSLERLSARLVTLALTAVHRPGMPVDEGGDQASTGPSGWRFRRRPGPGCRVFEEPLSHHERNVLPLWIRPVDAGSSASSAVEVEGRLPAISVVMPCFNLGRYLPEALESVFAQTTRDLEVIVVDDGSTEDFTRILLDEVSGPHVRVLRQANSGVAAARNRGIREARGRFICCLDPDDRIRPGFLARALEILEADDEVGLVSGHFQMFDERDEIYRFDAVAFPEALVHNPSVQPAVFRKSVWERIGGYWAGFQAPGIEDWDFWIRILEAGFRGEVIPEVVWDYRIRPGQMSEAMYEPTTWKALTRQLVERHEAHYRRHVVEVVAMHSEQWADLRRYTQECEVAAAWWREQACRWEQATGERGRAMEELRKWAAELERARQWWEDQAAEWKRIARPMRKLFSSIGRTVSHWLAPPRGSDDTSGRS